jgi:hypothetical protein
MALCPVLMCSLKDINAHLLSYFLASCFLNSSLYRSLLHLYFPVSRFPCLPLILVVVLPSHSQYLLAAHFNSFALLHPRLCQLYHSTSWPFPCALSSFSSF